MHEYHDFPFDFILDLEDKELLTLKMMVSLYIGHEMMLIYWYKE